MIELIVVKEAYRKQEVSRVGHISSHQTPTDALIKMGSCPSLNNILDSCLIKPDMNEKVIRKQNEEFDVNEAKEDRP